MAAILSTVHSLTVHVYTLETIPCNLGVYRSSVFGCVFTYHDCCIHLSMFGDILVQSTNTFPLSYDCLHRVFEVWEWSKLYTVFFSAYIYNLVTYVHFNSGVHTHVHVCVCWYMCISKFGWFALILLKWQLQFLTQVLCSVCGLKAVI